MNVILFEILKALTSDMIESLVSDLGLDEIDIMHQDNDVDSAIVNWLNDCVDIPFVSESTEEQVLHMVLDAVKAVILQKIT